MAAPVSFKRQRAIEAAAVDRLRREWLREVAAQGWSRGKAARVLGLRCDALRAMTDRLGISFPGDEVEREEFAACAAAGMTISETAAHLGVTHQMVQRRAQAFDLSFALPAPEPVSEAPPARKTLADLMREQAETDMSAVRRVWGI